MERPYPDEDARTAALDDRPTPRRNRRFRGPPPASAIPEYEPPESRGRGRAWLGKAAEEATSALPSEAGGEPATRSLPRDYEDRTSALPRGRDHDDATRGLAHEGDWRDDYGPPRQVVLDRYRLERRIGAGGFGVVWLAFDEKLEREVAVKVVPHEGDTSPEDSRAQREARVAARLNHPGIVALYELGSDDEAVYLVSELVPGRTLAELIRAGAVSDRDVAKIGSALCDALAHAHQKKVIHRDVKPQNVLVVDEPAAGAGFAKLADFGIAHLQSGDPLTRTGDVVGTLAYMAPEQAEGERVSAAADVYSLALTLYEGWTGQNPVRASSPMGTARRLGTVLPPLRSRRRDLPEELGRTIDQALDPDPERRPPIRQLRTALDAADRELSNEGGLVEPGTLERLGLRGREGEAIGIPLPSERALALAGRFAAGVAAGGLAAAALDYPDGAPPAPPLLIGTAVAIAVMLLPRLAWFAAAVAAGVWFVLPENGLSGAALVLVMFVAFTALALPSAGLLWTVPVLAPLLGAIGLAPLYVVVAGQATTVWRRAGLAASGFIWLAVAEIATGRKLLFGPADEWERSLNAAADHVLVPLFTTPVLLPGLAWIGLAVLLPYLVRGASLTLDLLGALVWTAALIAAHQAMVPLLGDHDPRGLGVAAVLAAAVAVGVPRMAGPR
jgi:eukaryotic-like serine/threonine-protein kinase